MPCLGLLSRRQILLGLAGAGGALASGGGQFKVAASIAAMNPGAEKPLHELSAGEALGALAQGQFTALEYVDALLDWQSRWAAINAWISRNPEALRAAATRIGVPSRDEQPLAGLPIAIKDNIDVEDWITTAGTPALAQYRPAATAPMVAGLLSRGSLVAGKVGLHELAAGGTCANLTWGQIRNPYDPGAIPGGSSGGTAAAVAARLVPAALGTDTGGSCRLPAALCGCVGFRPSSGRYDNRGIVPRNGRHDTIGWMARTATDVELLDAFSGRPAMRARAVALKGLRLGVPRRYFYEDLDDEVASLVENALVRLRDAGAVLVESDVQHVEQLHRAASADDGWSLFLRDLNRYLEASSAGVTVEALVHAVADPVLRRSMEDALPRWRLAQHDAQPQAAERELRDSYEQYFAGHRLDALVIPTSPIPAPPVPEEPSSGGSGSVVMIRNTGPAAVAGLPGLSLPAGLTAGGLPVGIEFDGPRNSDATLLRIGRLFESLVPPLPGPPPPATSSTAARSIAETGAARAHRRKAAYGPVPS